VQAVAVTWLAVSAAKAGDPLEQQRLQRISPLREQAWSTVASRLSVHFEHLKQGGWKVPKQVTNRSVGNTFPWQPWHFESEEPARNWE